MRTGEQSTRDQHENDPAYARKRTAGAATCQIVRGIGVHAAMSRMTMPVVTSTYVERSAAAGMTRVHARLNPARAITLCCTPKSTIKPTSMSHATVAERAGPTSIDRGTPRFSTNPTKTANVARDSAYTATAYARTTPDRAEDGMSDGTMATVQALTRFISGS